MLCGARQGVSVRKHGCYTESQAQALAVTGSTQLFAWIDITVGWHDTKANG